MKIGALETETRGVALPPQGIRRSRRLGPALVRQPLQGGPLPLVPPDIAHQGGA